MTNWPFGVRTPPDDSAGAVSTTCRACCWAAEGPWIGADSPPEDEGADCPCSAGAGAAAGACATSIPDDGAAATGACAAGAAEIVAGVPGAPTPGAAATAPVPA